ncbi:MAG TPA: hypothetical protein VFN19_02075 [Candidatus Nanopelagicales bacterium]|nr:hypothetical protein [Candidatus Nanopelagicales bacterium]
MPAVTIPTVALNDGTTLPALGLGTYPMRGDEAARAVGARLFDADPDHHEEM